MGRFKMVQHFAGGGRALKLGDNRNRMQIIRRRDGGLLHHLLKLLFAAARRENLRRKRLEPHRVPPRKPQLKILILDYALAFQQKRRGRDDRHGSPDYDPADDHRQLQALSHQRRKERSRRRGWLIGLEILLRKLRDVRTCVESCLAAGPMIRAFAVSAAFLAGEVAN